MRRLYALWAALLLLLLGGCGGHGAGSGPSVGAAGKGKATIRVKWPAPSRLIPNSAQSLVVVTKQGDNAVGTLLLKRPDATGTLTGLPYGTLAVEVRAFPSPDGSGVAQALGAGSMAVTEDTPGTVAISLASTVKRLVLAPVTVKKGLTAPATLSAQDEDGAIVPIDSETLAWTTDDSSIARVEGTGPKAMLTGVALGSTAVHASMAVDDGGDRITADGAVTVAAAVPMVMVTPATASTPASTFIGGVTHLSFTATTQDLPSSGVTWSTNGGQINNIGWYDAPTTAGTYTVTATSVDDPSIQGTAQVRVWGWLKVYAQPGYESVPGGTISDDGKAAFLATVFGMSDSRVTWTASSGTIDTGGVFTPAIGADADVTVKATSVEDPTATDAISFKVRRLLLSPDTAILYDKTTHALIGPTSVQLKTAGSLTAQGVTWSLTGAGTLSAGGVYKPPYRWPGTTGATVTITSQSDPSVTASANMGFLVNIYG